MMKLEKEIAQLNSQDTTSLEFSDQGQDYQLFRCLIPNKNKEKQYRYYLMNKQDKLGEGSSGSVYLSYLVENNIANLKKPVATKIFLDKSKFNRNEINVLRRYFFTEKELEEEKRIVLFTEYLGQEVISDDDIPNRDIAKLNFNQRIDLICQLVLRLNLLHHNTPRTGNPVIHCDIKGSNTLVRINKNDIYADFCDFGFAIELADDDPSLLIPIETRKSSPGYIPPEIVNLNKRGLKSDIYSFLPVALSILGVINPFSKKNNQYIEVENIQKNRDNTYSFNDIFTGYKIPAYIDKLKPLIKAFLNRMHMVDYNQRPDSDELLRFFITLKNYCANCEQEKDPVLQNILLSKLIILASGNWHQNIGNRVIEHFDTKSGTVIEAKKIIATKTFEQYDFYEHPVFSEIVVELYKRSKFDSDLVKTLHTQNDPAIAKIILNLINENISDPSLLKMIRSINVNVEAVKVLNKVNLLNKDSLQLITSSDRFAKNINQMTEHNANRLKKLSDIGKKYNLKLNLSQLNEIITDKGISGTAISKLILQAYRQQRLADKRGAYFHFWSKLTGFDCKTKCDAVIELIDVIDHKKTCVTDLSKKAINNGTLNHIVKDLKFFDAIPEDANITSKSLFCF